MRVIPRLRITEFLTGCGQTSVLNGQEQGLAFDTVHVVHPFSHDEYDKLQLVSYPIVAYNEAIRKEQLSTGGPL